MVSPIKEIKLTVASGIKNKESPAQKDTIKNSFGGINLRSPKIPELIQATS
jgi:hypothetical protein